MLSLRKEVHSRLKQEWATQEEYWDTAQVWGIKLGMPNWNLHTGLQELQTLLLQRWSQVPSTLLSSELPSDKKHWHISVNPAETQQEPGAQDLAWGYGEDRVILEHSSRMRSNRQEMQQGKTIQYKGKKL